MKNFLDISDLTSSELRAIIEEAKVRKSNRKDLKKSETDSDQPFQVKSMVMIFEKPFSALMLNNVCIPIALKYNYSVDY